MFRPFLTCTVLSVPCPGAPLPGKLEAVEAEVPDWDKGLPPDVLALVAKAGGMEAMKGMRGASKNWQQGFELGVSIQLLGVAN